MVSTKTFFLSRGTVNDNIDNKKKNFLSTKSTY